MFVERQQVVVQRQLHLAHGALYLVGLQLALPDDDDLPAARLQLGVVALVALLVAAYFLQPEAAVGLWNLAAGGAFNFQF